jgi:hypothetical protein
MLVFRGRLDTVSIHVLLETDKLELLNRRGVLGVWRSGGGWRWWGRVGHISCAEVCVRALNGDERCPILTGDSTSMLASEDDVRYKQYLNGRRIPKSAIIDDTSTYQ